MTERPKPITRALEPIDRSRPRAVNLLGFQAFVASLASWVLAGFGLVFAVLTGLQGPRSPFCYVPAGLAAVAAWALAIGALVRAHYRHLELHYAIAGMLLALVPIGLLTWDWLTSFAR
jgi:hypothetical protein